MDDERERKRHKKKRKKLKNKVKGSKRSLDYCLVSFYRPQLKGRQKIKNHQRTSSLRQHTQM